MICTEDKNITYASLGKRFWAYVIDVIFFFVVTFIVAILSVAFLNELLVTIISVIVNGLIEFLLLKVLKGKTVGKLILKIRVVDAETFEMPSNKSLIKRIILLRPLLGILGLLQISAINLLYISLNVANIQRKMNGQALWDSFANTVVIKD